MALVLTIFLVSLDMTIVATAIPCITNEFKSLDQESTYQTTFTKSRDLVLTIGIGGMVYECLLPDLHFVPVHMG
jgi:hypothetical protein